MGKGIFFSEQADAACEHFSPELLGCELAVLERVEHGW